MKRVRQLDTVSAGLGIIAVLFLMFIGCTTLSENKGGPEYDDKGFAPPTYFDFGDVRIPEELKVDKDSTFVYRTAGLSAGVLVLEGRVELYSLITFFENSMATDNWTFISSFKSPRTIMLFQKESRWCVINITEKLSNTLVEIWVSPTSEVPGSGLMK